MKIERSTHKGEESERDAVKIEDFAVVFFPSTQQWVAVADTGAVLSRATSLTEATADAFNKLGSSDFDEDALHDYCRSFVRRPTREDRAFDALIVQAMRGEVVVAAPPEVVPDWRIGCSCKPKMRTHELYYERGEIVEVFPSGTAGIHDKDGVLKIRMQSGRVLMAPADEWQTA